jgi:hypothetical protein
MSKLTKICIENWPQLKQMFFNTNRVINSPSVVSIANILSRIQKSPNFAKKIEVLSIDDLWKSNGTYLIKNGDRVFFNTLEPPPYVTLKNALNLLPVTDELILPFVSDRFRNVVDEFGWLNGLDLLTKTGYSDFYMSKEDALKLPDIPYEFYFKIKLNLIYFFKIAGRTDVPSYNYGPVR